MESSFCKTKRSAFTEHSFQGRILWWLEQEKMQEYIISLGEEFWRQKYPWASVTSPWLIKKNQNKTKKKTEKKKRKKSKKKKKKETKKKMKRKKKTKTKIKTKTKNE